MVIINKTAGTEERQLACNDYQMGVMNETVE